MQFVDLTCQRITASRVLELRNAWLAASRAAPPTAPIRTTSPTRHGGNRSPQPRTSPTLTRRPRSDGAGPSTSHTPSGVSGRDGDPPVSVDISCAAFESSEAAHMFIGLIQSFPACVEIHTAGVVIHRADSASLSRPVQRDSEGVPRSAMQLRRDVRRQWNESSFVHELERITRGHAQAIAQAKEQLHHDALSAARKNIVEALAIQRHDVGALEADQRGRIVAAEAVDRKTIFTFVRRDLHHVENKMRVASRNDVHKGQLEALVAFESRGRDRIHQLWIDRRATLLVSEAEPQWRKICQSVEEQERVQLRMRRDTKYRVTQRAIHFRHAEEFRRRVELETQALFGRHNLNAEERDGYAAISAAFESELATLRDASRDRKTKEEDESRRVRLRNEEEVRDHAIRAARARAERSQHHVALMIAVDKLEAGEEMARQKLVSFDKQIRNLFAEMLHATRDIHRRVVALSHAFDEFDAQRRRHPCIVACSQCVTAQRPKVLFEDAGVVEELDSGLSLDVAMPNGWREAAVASVEKVQNCVVRLRDGISMHSRAVLGIMLRQKELYERSGFAFFNSNRALSTSSFAPYNSGLDRRSPALGEAASTLDGAVSPASPTWAGSPVGGGIDRVTLSFAGDSAITGMDNGSLVGSPLSNAARLRSTIRFQNGAEPGSPTAARVPPLPTFAALKPHQILSWSELQTARDDDFKLLFCVAGDSSALMSASFSDRGAMSFGSRGMASNLDAPFAASVRSPSASQPSSDPPPATADVLHHHVQVTAVDPTVVVEQLETRAMERAAREIEQPAAQSPANDPSAAANGSSFVECWVEMSVEDINGGVTLPSDIPTTMRQPQPTSGAESSQDDIDSAAANYRRNAIDLAGVLPIAARGMAPTGAVTPVPIAVAIAIPPPIEPDVVRRLASQGSEDDGSMHSDPSQLDRTVDPSRLASGQDGAVNFLIKRILSTAVLDVADNGQVREEDLVASMAGAKKGTVYRRGDAHMFFAIDVAQLLRKDPYVQFFATEGEDKGEEDDAIFNMPRVTDDETERQSLHHIAIGITETPTFEVATDGRGRIRRVLNRLADRLRRHLQLRFVQYYHRDGAIGTHADDDENQSSSAKRCIALGRRAVSYFTACVVMRVGPLVCERAHEIPGIICRRFFEPRSLFRTVRAEGSTRVPLGAPFVVRDSPVVHATSAAADNGGFDLLFDQKSIVSAGLPYRGFAGATLEVTLNPLYDGDCVYMDVDSNRRWRITSNGTVFFDGHPVGAAVDDSFQPPARDSENGMSALERLFLSNAKQAAMMPNSVNGPISLTSTQQQVTSFLASLDASVSPLHAGDDATRDVLVRLISLVDPPQWFVAGFGSVAGLPIADVLGPAEASNSPAAAALAVRAKSAGEFEDDMLDDDAGSAMRGAPRSIRRRHVLRLFPTAPLLRPDVIASLLDTLRFCSLAASPVEGRRTVSMRLNVPGSKFGPVASFHVEVSAIDAPTELHLARRQVGYYLPPPIPVESDPTLMRLLGHTTTAVFLNTRVQDEDTDKFKGGHVTVWSPAAKQGDHLWIASSDRGASEPAIGGSNGPERTAALRAALDRMPHRRGIVIVPHAVPTLAEPMAQGVADWLVATILYNHRKFGELYCAFIDTDNGTGDESMTSSMGSPLGSTKKSSDAATKSAVNTGFRKAAKTVQLARSLMHDSSTGCRAMCIMFDEECQPSIAGVQELVRCIRYSASRASASVVRPGSRDVFLSIVIGSTVGRTDELGNNIDAESSENEPLTDKVTVVIGPSPIKVAAKTSEVTYTEGSGIKRLPLVDFAADLTLPVVSHPPPSVVSSLSAAAIAADPIGTAVVLEPLSYLRFDIVQGASPFDRPCFVDLDASDGVRTVINDAPNTAEGFRRLFQAIPVAAFDAVGAGREPAPPAHGRRPQPPAVASKPTTMTAAATHPAPPPDTAIIAEPADAAPALAPRDDSPAGHGSEPHGSDEHSRPSSALAAAAAAPVGVVASPLGRRGSSPMAAAGVAAMGALMPFPVVLAPGDAGGTTRGRRSRGASIGRMSLSVASATSQHSLGGLPASSAQSLDATPVATPLPVTGAPPLMPPPAATGGGSHETAVPDGAASGHSSSESPPDGGATVVAAQHLVSRVHSLVQLGFDARFVQDAAQLKVQKVYRDKELFAIVVSVPTVVNVLFVSRVRRKDLMFAMRAVAYHNPDANPRQLMKVGRLTLGTAECPQQIYFDVKIIPVDDPLDITLAYPSLRYRLLTTDFCSLQMFGNDVVEELKRRRVQHAPFAVKIVSPSAQSLPTTTTELAPPRASTDAAPVNIAADAPVAANPASTTVDTSCVELPELAFAHSTSGNSCVCFPVGSITLFDPDTVYYDKGVVTIDVQSANARSDAIGVLPFEMQLELYKALGRRPPWVFVPSGTTIPCPDDRSEQLRRTSMLQQMSASTAVTRSFDLYSAPEGGGANNDWDIDPARAVLTEFATMTSALRGNSYVTTITFRTKNAALLNPPKAFANAWNADDFDGLEQSLGPGRDLAPVLTLPLLTAFLNVIYVVFSNNVSGLRTVRLTITDGKNPIASKASLTIDVLQPFFACKDPSLAPPTLPSAAAAAASLPPLISTSLMNQAQLYMAVTRTRNATDLHAVCGKLPTSFSDNTVFASGYIEVFLLPSVSSATDQVSLRMNPAVLAIKANDQLVAGGRDVIGKVITSPKYVRLDMLPGGKFASGKRIVEFLRSIFLVVSTQGSRRVAIVFSDNFRVGVSSTATLPTTASSPSTTAAAGGGAVTPTNPSTPVLKEPKLQQNVAVAGGGRATPPQLQTDVGTNGLYPARVDAGLFIVEIDVE